MKNKKTGSFQWEFLVGLCIFLALLVVFISIYIPMKQKMTEGSIREIRRQSVRENVYAHVKGMDFSGELNFPIIRMDVKKGEELEKASKAEVADWGDLLRGKQELFPAGRGENIVYCIPGHYLRFKDKKNISLLDLSRYQNTHTIRSIGEYEPGDKDYIISEYIIGYATNKVLFEDEMKKLKDEFGNNPRAEIVDDNIFFKEEGSLSKIYSINTEYDYMSVFVYMKRGYWMKWLSGVFGGMGGMVGGFALGIVLVPFTGGGSLVITAIVVSATAAGTASGGIMGYMMGSDVSADWDAGIFLVPNKADILKDLKCDELPAGREIE